MRRNDGIVIVASLIVMMVVLGIAVGMLFMTQTNLKITDNARSKAQAEALAESGTDAILIALEHYFDKNDGKQMPSFADGTFGSDFVQPTISTQSGNVPYTVKTFGQVGSDYVLEVYATTPNGATHLSKVLFAGLSGDGEAQPVYASGLVSEGVITLNGTSNFVSAGLHGNGGYVMNGFNNTTWRRCLTRNQVTGKCETHENIQVDSLPVSAAANLEDWKCEPNHPYICDAEGNPKFLTSPVTITPNYLGRRNAAIAAASRGTTRSVLFNINCDTVYTVAPSLTTSNLNSRGFSSGRTVCVESGMLTLPKNATLNGVKVISRGQIKIDTNTTIINSLLVSTEQSVSGGNIKVTLRDSRIYSQGDISFNGQQSSFEGMTTLASAGKIEVNGSSKISYIEDKIKIGVGFVAEGDITINGSSDWFAVSVTGGQFRYNGNATLHGSVAAVGEIISNGGIDIDSGLAISNDDFLKFRTQETLAENSRR